MYQGRTAAEAGLIFGKIIRYQKVPQLVDLETTTQVN